MRVNGRLGRASLRLQDGDRIHLGLPETTRPTRLEPEAHPLKIVFEDDSLLVLDKAPGMVVHPGAGVRTGTLVQALLHHHPAIAEVGGEGRPGIVHRLDKDTSGLMVVAKTERAYRNLVQAIQEHRVERVYRALVWGLPARESGRIEAPIGRDPHRRQRMAVVSRGGKPAATRWQVLERFGPVTLLALTLESGRTHQIRVHLSHLRFPVVGDPLYGGRGKKLLSLASRERSLGSTLLERLPRQALHASELRLGHPITGKSLHFTAPLPEDFGQAVEMLRAWFQGRRD